MRFFVGIDWAAGRTPSASSTSPAASAAAPSPHTAEGLAELVGAAAPLRPPAGCPSPSSAPRACSSTRSSPPASRRAHPPQRPQGLPRPRYSAAGGKSDPATPIMLADMLRTDGHRFRPLAPCSDEIRALRALVRGRDDLVAAARRASPTSCAACSRASGPAPPPSSPTSTRPIALAFLARYPTPESAARLGEKRLAAFLAQHAYCGRRAPAELLARLRAAPAGLAGEAEAEAKGEIVRALAAVLEPLVGADRASSPPHRARRRRAARRPDRHVLPARRRASAPPRSSPSSATSANASRATTSSPPRPASAPSPTPPARAAASSSAGPATTACAAPSPASPTTPATPRPWAAARLPARPQPRLRPSARHPHPRPRLGRASSGAAGRIAHPTTSTRHRAAQALAAA